MRLLTVLASTAAGALLGFVTGVSVASRFLLPHDRVVGWGLSGALVLGSVSAAWFFHFRNAGGKGAKIR